MADCCDPSAYGRLFNDKEAQRRLRSYRRSGLDDIASGMVDFMKTKGIGDRSVLEIGGGVGDLQVELLKGGASHSVNVELSPGYEGAATELMVSEGLEGRMERQLGDFVERQELVDSADVVVLSRVICCYPWVERMMDAALIKTRWLLAIAVPRDHMVSRFFVGVGNTVNRLRRCGFRAYVHPLDVIEGKAERAGLRRVYLDRGLVWQGLVFERHPVDIS
jgi:hypothetical protein